MATAGVGTLLKIGANSIAELSSIGGLRLSADTIDTTALDNTNGYKTFITGFKDGGDVSASGFFKPGDTNGQYALYTAFQAGTLLTMSIVFPSAMGAEWDFQGVVTAFETDTDVSGSVGFNATIKVSGVPTLSVTASADLTTLALTATGGTLAPTFAGTTYFYAMSGITGTTIKVKATLTTIAEAYLYVNGVYLEALASGVDSSSIAISAIGETKKCTVLYKEAGKSFKTYEVICHKTA